MKTNELIDLLATGLEPAHSPARARGNVMAFAAGLTAAALLVALALGVQPDLAQKIHLPQFWLREGFCALVGLAALVCTWRLVHPGERTQWR